MAATMNSSASPKTFRNPWVWLIIALPSTAVIASMVTIYLAIVSADGLVTDDYYKEGMEINRTMDRDNKAAELQLLSVVTLNPVDGNVLLTLSADENYQMPEQLNLSIVHRTRAGLDQKMIVNKVSHGQYEGKSGQALPPGRWSVVLETDEWRLRRKLTTRDQHPVYLRLDPGFTEQR